MIHHLHIDRILEGTKTWEIRGSKTLVRETIGLIASGSGTVVGVCDVVGSVPPPSRGFLKERLDGVVGPKLRVGQQFAPPPFRFQTRVYHT